MINILTINTWKCDGEYHNRREVLAKQLSSLSAQAILLQEVFSNIVGNINTAKYLADKLNMEYTFLPERRKIRELNGEYIDSYSGLAILATIPFDEKYPISLPSTNEDGGRSALIAEYTFSGIKMAIANIHLSHLRNGSNLRQQQLEAILAHPVFNREQIKVIGGDFNCTLDDPEIHNFSKPPYYIKDTYEIGMGKQPSFTCPVISKQKNRNPRKIDHIVTLANKDGIYPQFKKSKIVLNKIDAKYNIYPSDHFGVMTSLIL